MFRIGGYVNLDSTDVFQDQKFRITVGPKKNKISFIQYLKPLSPEHPYFFVHIVNLGKYLFFKYDIIIIFDRTRKLRHDWNS